MLADIVELTTALQGFIKLKGSCPFLAFRHFSFEVVTRHKPQSSSKDGNYRS